MNRIIILLITLMTISCSSKKNILLIQDINLEEIYETQFNDIRVKSDDILRIKVFSYSEELSNIFNSSSTLSSGNLESIQIDGYQVNQNGFINFPVIGELFVKDLTIDEISNLISKSLSSAGILVNAIVDVKIINSYFTVLGEVNLPGKYNFINNNINLLEAIGTAGGITINGERNNIKLIRKFGDNYIVSNIDLTSSEFLTSQNLQILSRDIIIVDPNNSKIKSAGVIGNAGNLLSLLSFLLSSIILITAR